MSLAASTPLAQYDLVGVREDLSDIVSEILLSDKSLLARIGISGEAANVKHEWLEDSLNAVFATGDATGLTDTTGTTLTVASGHGARLRIGALLRDTAQGSTEVIQVTAISTDTITIVRGFGSTVATTHAGSLNWRIIGMPQQSGQDMSADRSVVRSRVANYCQIFERGVNIAGDVEAVLKAGVPSEVARQSTNRLIELMRELDNSIMMGYAPAATQSGSDTVYRSMNGLVYFLSQSTGNVRTTDESISEPVLNQMFHDAYDDGGNPSLLVVNQSQMKAISQFNSDKIRIAPGANAAGVFVTHFFTDLGTEIEILLDRWMPDDTAMILDLSRLAVVPLQGRQFGMSVIAPTGDAQKRQLLGDYTLECRNALQAHAIHTNLKIPA